MKFLLPLALLVTVTMNAQTVTHSQIRHDILPPDIEDVVFPEGWREPNQFYPRYYRPAATIQIFLKNTGAVPLQDIQLELNGKPIDEITTRADFAGPVIWHRINPEIIPPGGTAMVYIRLREKPETPPVVGISGVKTTIPLQAPAFRIAYVSYSESLDTLNIYALKNHPVPAQIKEIFIDGTPVKAEKTLNVDFAADAPAHLQLKLATPLRHGQYFELKLAGGNSATAAQLRALPSRFLLGLVGGTTPRNAAKLFNLTYILHPSQNFPDNFQSDTQIIWRPVPAEKKITQVAAQLPRDKFIYGNADEPDAHEPPGLPYMQRSGINIMRQVEPVMKLQRRLDPHHPTSLMIDRTYAPHNWYTYGEVPDLPFNDCYTPTQWMAFDLHIVAQTLPFLLNAFGPRPVNLMLWACTNTGHRVRRAPTPEENEIQVLYALGTGVKGLHYFVDWTSFPQRSEGGYYIGASRIKPLWDQLGRNNARITRMAELLSNSYPAPFARSSNPAKLWSGALMSGSTEILIFAANRNITISATDHLNFPYLRTADGEITVTLPPWFTLRRAVNVEWDKTSPLSLTAENGKLVIPVKNLRTGMAIVLSSNPDIETHLQLDETKLAALKNSETLPERTGSILESFEQPERKIDLADRNKLELNFGSRDIMNQLSRLNIANAELRQVPDQMLILYPGPEALESRAEIEFKFHSEKPIRNLQLELQGENAVGYHANMLLELIPATGKTASDTTLRFDWFSGQNKREKLSVKHAEPLTDFTVRVSLKTPNIVHSADFAALARNLTLSWE